LTLSPFLTHLRLNKFAPKGCDEAETQAHEIQRPGQGDFTAEDPQIWRDEI
jgi:hypothetical protein